jgi:hypothetical protein
MNIIKECLCGRPTEDDKTKTPGRINEHGTLRIGMEHTCKVEKGVGSCGLPFYEDNEEHCRWCCQVLKYD